MLSEADLKQKLSKDIYKKEIKQLHNKLKELQLKIKELGIPVIIAFEGWSCAGKGKLIGSIVYPLDPRYFKVFTMSKMTEERIMRPALYSYWMHTPEAGNIAIFDKSWHRVVLPEGVAKHKISEKAKEAYIYDVNSFEKTLSDSGALIIKIFLHISKEEQEKRIQKLEKNEETKWRVDEHDRQQNKDYEKWIKFYDDMLEKSNTEENPWTIIEGENKNYSVVKTYQEIISRIENFLKNKDKKVQQSSYTPITEKLLEHVDVSLNISNNDYDAKLDYYQKKLAILGFKMYKKRKSAVVLYEGWDAAGKGGNIKRLTEELDPRGYEVIPIAAPTKSELSQHYLWRFWREMPKDGHMAIFDRSWYGRVMVERLEGFCTEEEWHRAYREINDMERHMTNHGTIILKFWLHIDREEQLARFKARQEDPAKQHKITDEDWRNREKWNLYEAVVDEMLLKTSTEHAKWTIIESNNKKYARIKVLEIVTKELERHLD